MSPGSDIFLNLLILLICMYKCSALHVCLCTMCVAGAYGGKKMVLDPLGLELQTIVGLHVGAGNKT